MPDLTRLSPSALASIMADSSRDVILLLGRDGRVIEANPAAVATYGYSHAELVGMTLADLRSPETHPDIPRHYDLAAQGEGALFETEHRRRDGSVFPVEVNAHSLVVGDERIFVSVVRDITKRVHEESRLKQSEAMFRAVVEQSPIPISCHRHGTPIFANSAHRRLHGYEKYPEFSSIAELIAPENRDAVLDRIRRRAEGLPAESEFEFIGRRQDGTTFPAYVKTAPVELADGPATLVFYIDLTEQKRLEEQVRQAQKMEAIGQLAGGVAHDFNNILASTMMQIGLLQMSPNLDAEMSAALRELEDQAKRAAALTRQLLMFSRRSVLDVRRVDVNLLLDGLLKMLRRLIGEDIDLEYVGGTGVPAIEADAGMLEQVVTNLVVNARDAMPGGGRLTIRTAVETCDADAAHPERRPGRFARLAVTDTGCGMDSATLARIFEPFFTTKEAGKGTGLGLATAQGIVAQHHGWMEVESAVGRGTTFAIYLPEADGNPGELASVAQGDVPRGRQEGILLVEDEASVRRNLARMLTALGYRVFEAGSGREALQVWSSAAADVRLVMTDVVMPEGMSGLELVQRLRALRPGLRAIVSSGYSADLVEGGAPRERGTMYLAKPFQPERLARAVRDCLDAAIES